MKETSIISFCKIYNNFNKFFVAISFKEKLSITADFNRPYYHFEHRYLIRLISKCITHEIYLA